MGCRRKEGKDRGKKKRDGSLSHIACAAESIISGEPDVRHSHQTFQIKGPPHLSTPLSNPLSISSSLTIKSVRSPTHTLARLTHTHTVRTYTLTYQLLALVF